MWGIDAAWLLNNFFIKPFLTPSQPGAHLVLYKNLTKPRHNARLFLFWIGLAGSLAQEAGL
jgi:hypothetical protein